MKIKMTSEMKRKHEAVKAKLLQGIDPEKYEKHRLIWGVASVLTAEKRMHGDYSPLTFRELAAALEGTTVEQIRVAQEYFDSI